MNSEHFLLKNKTVVYRKETIHCSKSYHIPVCIDILKMSPTKFSMLLLYKQQNDSDIIQNIKLA